MGYFTYGTCKINLLEILCYKLLSEILHSSSPLDSTTYFDTILKLIIDVCGPSLSVEVVRENINVCCVTI